MRQMSFSIRDSRPTAPLMETKRRLIEKKNRNLVHTIHTIGTSPYEFGWHLVVLGTNASRRVVVSLHRTL